MPTYPVTFEMDYEHRHSRPRTFFRPLLAIPHFLFFYGYTIAFFFVYVAAWLALMITGRWPRGLFGFAAGYLRYTARLTAYLNLAVDAYPPFGGGDDEAYPVRVRIEPPQAHYSRLKVFFRGVYAILAFIIRYALGIVLSFVAFLAWWAIVVTGRLPASLWNAMNFSLSYTVRADALLFLITETYPPMGDAASALPQAI